MIQQYNSETVSVSENSKCIKKTIDMWIKEYDRKRLVASILKNVYWVVVYKIET